MNKCVFCNPLATKNKLPVLAGYNDSGPCHPENCEFDPIKITCFCLHCMEWHTHRLGYGTECDFEEVTRDLKTGEYRLILVDPIHCTNGGMAYYINPNQDLIDKENICIEHFESNSDLEHRYAA